ncbi:MAG: hypothetical protein ACI8S6_003815 [Myxococcota bacterium]|jgi:hypothetical protein
MAVMMMMMMMGCIGDTTEVVVVDPTEETSAPGSSPYLTPIAVGFEYVGGWDEHNDALESWSYNSLDYEPYIRIVLVEDGYFSNSDEATHYLSFCEVLATLDGGSAPIEARSYETDSPHSLRASYVGTLTVFGYGDGDCSNFDPELWPGGEPRWVIDGMTLGLGFGEHTDFLEQAWSEQVIDQYSDYMLGAWIAYDRPTDDGGVEFVAHDWTTALLWQRDALSGELVTDDEDRPIGQDINDPVLSGWVSSYAYFFDNIENFIAM